MTLTDEATLQLGDTAMAMPSVPEPGKGLILEARDGSRRALRARAAEATERS